MYVKSVRSFSLSLLLCVCLACGWSRGRDRGRGRDYVDNAQEMSRELYVYVFVYCSFRIWSPTW